MKSVLDERAPAPGQEQPARKRTWRVVAITALLAVIATLAFTAVADSYSFRVRGGAGGGAVLACPGGMDRLSHEWGGGGIVSVFPGDPDVIVDVPITVPVDGFRVESIHTGTHAGTHIDVPAHFYSNGRSLEELHATEFVWPAYVIDVRDRIAEEGPDFVLEKRDIRAYERANGNIKNGSMVIIHTGHDMLFGGPLYPAVNHPGFSADATQWMFDKRHIAGVGSDGYGPDATIDTSFGSTAVALDPANDGVAMPGINNLDTMNVKGDVIIASAVPLVDGSGFQVDPLACHGNVWAGRQGFHYND